MTALTEMLNSLPTAPVRRTDRPCVAVVGAGAAGIATAYYLTRLGIRVELFEARGRLGGNCRRVRLPGTDGEDILVDMGVSDFNRVTFRRFDGFLNEMGVDVRPICEDATAMYHDGSTAWSSLQGRFTVSSGSRATRRLAAEIARFVKTTPAVLETGDDVTLGEYLARENYSNQFKTLYARPRAAGCIVMPGRDPDDHDMRSLIKFWQLHGLVGDQPRQRMHVVGGMWSYCDAFARWFEARGGVLRLNTWVRGILRDDEGVRLEYDTLAGPGSLAADHVVVAVDASRVGDLVRDADEDEHRAVESVRYERAEVVVHTDRRLMPRDPAAWGAYQFYVGRPGDKLGGPSITFYPQRLAGLTEAAGVFVTLNPPIQPRGHRVLSRRHLIHPIANPTASRPDLFDRVQGRRNTWYAGSYLEAPWLHEQAFRSGERVAEAIFNDG